DVRIRDGARSEPYKSSLPSRMQGVRNFTRKIRKLLPDPLGNVITRCFCREFTPLVTGYPPAPDNELVLLYFARGQQSRLQWCDRRAEKSVRRLRRTRSRSLPLVMEEQASSPRYPWPRHIRRRPDTDRIVGDCLHRNGRSRPRQADVG